MKYASPELFNIIDRSNYVADMGDSVVDVYAFAILLWAVLEKRIPWEDLNRNDEIKSSVMSGKRPPISEEIGNSYDPLILKLLSIMRDGWSHDASLRPS